MTDLFGYIKRNCSKWTLKQKKDLLKEMENSVRILKREIERGVA